MKEGKQCEQGGSAGHSKGEKVPYPFFGPSRGEGSLLGSLSFFLYWRDYGCVVLHVGGSHGHVTESEHSKVGIYYCKDHEDVEEKSGVGDCAYQAC